MNSPIVKEVSLWLPFVEKIEEEFSRVSPAAQRNAGIGGLRHQQIQLLVRNSALDLGYGAQIEQQIPGGQRLVDVGIRGHDVQIACEIPISSKYNEYGNIRKCLDAGFTFVISVALERETHDIVKKGIWEKLSGEEKKRVKFFFPEELIEFLASIKPAVTPNSLTQTIRGYKVKVTQSRVSEDEGKRIRDVIAGVVARSILRQGQSK